VGINLRRSQRQGKQEPKRNTSSQKSIDEYGRKEASFYENSSRGWRVVLLSKRNHIQTTAFNSLQDQVTNSCSDQSHVVSESFLKAVSVSAVSFRVERIFFCRIRALDREKELAVLKL